MELISLLLSCPITALPTLLATPAVSSTLLHIVHHSTPSSPDRVQLQHLITHLSSLKGGLSLPLLAVYCASFGSTNRELVKQTVDSAVKHDAELSQQLLEVAPQLMDEAIRGALEAGIGSPAQLHLTLAPHLALAISHPLISSSYGQSQSTLRAINKLYTNLSHSQAASLAPALELKLSLLETTHTLLSAAFLDPLLHPRGVGEGPLLREERNAFIDELEAALLPLLPPPVSSSHTVQSLVSASLLQDLQHYYQLSGKVDQASQGLIGQREASAKELLRRVRESVGGLEGEDGLDVLKRLRQSGLSTTASAPVAEVLNSKGKQRATSQDPLASSVDEVSPLAISQISDLFPDLSHSFIRSCLLHPAFSGGDSSAERVIGALLEDSLPDELKNERDGTAAPDGEEVPEPRQPPRVATPPPAVAPSRRNVFDDQLMAGKIRRGKERSTADALLADRTFMDDTYKASIIAAAERESSDEEGEEGEAFVEDFDAGGRAFGVRDAGEDEHEESREKDSRDVTPAGSGRNTPVPTSSAPPHRDPLANPFGPAVSHYLEETYIKGPSFFDRKGEVRRSKERKLLRERTGLSDEQVEGWRVMLERDPKKDKILARHGQVSSTSTGSSVVVTTTAIPQANTNHLHDAPASTWRQGGPSRGGRGGSSGGRGGGDAGRGGARDGGAGRGKSDGGRAASDRRTRGADKKASKLA